jgi:acyl carrier protein
MLLADDRTRQALGPLKALFVGGEPLAPPLAARLREAVTGEVWNMYGPTETTVWSTAWRVEGSAPAVSIGRPIANTQTYVLDAALEPRPPGLSGHLFIGGNGVARGYWGRPDLSADRFQPNPFVAGDGRMYRTGDMVRQRRDGSLEFLGRSDHQVKIRGHRIELGEIEAALAMHPTVDEAVVVAREDVPDDRRLVAYVVGRTTGHVQPSTLREYLSGKLPDYMVPAQIALLEVFPLTPNGKIDRRALPAPDLVAAQEQSHVAPTTDLERVVASVWQEVLRVGQVGTEDNFFDRGGDSLLAAQVLSLLRSRVSDTVSLTDLFRFPTVRALSDHLGGKTRTASPVSQSLDRARRRQQAGKQRSAARAHVREEADRP